MSQSAKPRTPHFTIFRSAAAEVAGAFARDERANRSGHMHAKSGHVVQTPEAPKPHKVVFDHEGGEDTEQACAANGHMPGAPKR
jgi:hypothetical protein